VELVYIIMVFDVLLYIPLVPSLNKIEGLVTDEYLGNIDSVVYSNCVDESMGYSIFIYIII
jgi:hypothetical protein